MDSPVFRIPPVLVDHRFFAAVDQPPWHVTDHNLPQFWEDSGAGEGVTVAVLDTGIDDSHSEFAGMQVQRLSALGDDGFDRQGHGTHVAGIIGGQLVGIAPKCKLISIKVLGDDGSGSDRGVAKGILMAVERGAQVINMSLGAPSASQILARACRDAAEAGTVLVAATGNEAGTRVSYPANFDDWVLAVGAIDRQKQRATFSNYDAGNLVVDLVDYGVQVLSCVPRGRYQRMSGTSMATPCVTGMVANRLSRERMAGSMPVERVRERYALLRHICEDLGATDRDHKYGWGLIDSARAFGPDAYGLDQPSPPPEDEVILSLIRSGDGRAIRLPDGKVIPL